MKRLLCLALSAFIMLTAFAKDYPYAKLYKGLPIVLEQPQLPQIPDNTLSVKTFGAVGDGKTDCTDAFRRAMDKLAEMGGGVLLVPEGRYLTGPIRLKSRIDLHLDKGAVIVFTPDKRAYFPKDSEGRPLVKGRALPCISADKCEDISITGEGTLDGNGQWWRYAKRDKYSEAEWTELQSLGGTLSADGKLWFPYNLKGWDNLTDAPEKEEAIRNHMIIIKRCKRVLIKGVTVCNSPKFHINPAMCEDVILDGLTVRCPWNAQNGDGIDIGNSRRVLVTDCLVDCGDDGICMKGGSGAKGVKAGPCRDILICRNTVLHAHGGFVIGSDFSGGMEKIVVRDCLFDGSDIGLRFKSMAGRGGKCKDIWISRIRMKNIPDAAISFKCDYEDVTYKTLASGEGKPAEYLPEFCDIHISDVKCSSCVTGVYARGMKGARCVYDIFISRSRFKASGKVTDIDENTTEVHID